MSLQFFDHDTHVAVRNIPTGGRVEKIPPSVYQFRVTKDGLDMMRDRKSFTLPARIYGKHHMRRKMIMEEFELTSGSLGVILQGMKGGGKSLLGEALCNECLKLEMPVLLVNEPITAQVLKSVIELIGSCAVYFDEFGKIYDKDDRAKMLTLFSDTDLKNVMFIVTANEDKELNEFMIDRPGRFMFKIDYGHIDQDVVKEVCTSLDVIPELTDYLLAYNGHHDISMDILMYLARQAQRCPTVKEYIERIELLNVPKPVYRSMSVAEVSFKGAAFVGEIIERYDGDHLEIDLMQDGTLEMVGSFVYDRNTANIAELYATYDHKRRRVQFSADVAMVIIESYSPYASGEGNRRRKAKVTEKGDSTLESE